MTTKQQREERLKTLLAFSRETTNPVFSGVLCNDGGSVNRLGNLLDELHRYETTLHRIAENDCNGHLKTICDGKHRYTVEDTDWAARDAKKEERIQIKIRAVAEDLGFKVQFNGDPRGGAIRFVLPSGASNNWDHETWGIYW